MSENCVNRLIKTAKGAVTPARAQELLADFLDEQGKLRDNGQEFKLSDISGNEQYKIWLEKGVAQERFNKYNDLLKRQDLYGRVDLSSTLERAKESIEDIFDNTKEKLNSARKLRALDFNAGLNEAGVMDIYHARDFDQPKTALYLSRLNSKNKEAVPTLKTIPVEDINEFKIAQVMAKYSKDTLTMKRNMGVNLGDLEGRIGRTKHNPHTLSIPGQDKAWKEWALTDGHVEWDIMFLDGKSREEYLDEMLANIQAGTHSDDGIHLFEIPGADPEGVMQKQKQKLYGSLAASAGKQRKFMINPEHWYEYNKSFGDGDLVTMFNNELLRDARIEAMLDTFGSNPEANMKAVKAQLIKDGKRFGTEGAHDFDKLIDERFNYISGKLDRKASGTVGRMGATARSFFVADKLGSALWSSLSDLTSSQFRKSLFLNEKNFGKNMQIGATGLAKNFKRMVGIHGSEYAKAVYEGALAEMKALTYFMRNEMRYMNEFSIDANGRPDRTIWDKFGNFSNDVNHVVGFTNLLEVFTNRGVAGQYDGWAAELGSLAHRSLDDINEVTRNELKGAGLEDVWDLIRKKVVTVEEDGQKYIPPNVLDDITDAELEAFDITAKTARGKALLRQKLKLKMRSAFAQEAHQRVPVPTASTDPKSLFQIQPGTIEGEAKLAVMMFRSFPITFWKQLIAPAWKHNKSAFAANLAFAIPTLLTGIWIKDILNGETPRPFFNPDGEHDWDVVARNWAGVLVSGFGVPVGDRMIAELAGGEAIDKGRAISDLAGPMAGYAVDTVNNLFNVGKGLVTGDTDKAKKGGAKLLLNAPVLSPILHSNLFSRMVRNMIDHNIMEAASPGYIDNLENISEKAGKTRYQLPQQTEAFVEDLLEGGLIR